MAIRDVTVVDVNNGSLRLILLALLLAAEGRAVAQEKGVPQPAPDAPAALQDMVFGDFEFRDERGRSDRPIHIWYARPADAGPETKLVFVLHGDQRIGERVRDIAAPLAAPYGFTVVAPNFPQEGYPGDVYDLGRDFVLLVGERDIREGPRPPPVRAQGESRVSRAFRLFAAAHEAAVAHGVPLKWRLRVVPDLDHSPIETLALDFDEIARHHGREP